MFKNVFKQRVRLYFNINRVADATAYVEAQLLRVPILLVN